MFNFINNDTIALIVLGSVAIIGAITKQDIIVSASIGAIAGYIGAKTLNDK